MIETIWQAEARIDTDEFYRTDRFLAAPLADYQLDGLAGGVAAWRTICRSRLHYLRGTAAMRRLQPNDGTRLQHRCALLDFQASWRGYRAELRALHRALAFRAQATLQAAE